MTVSCRRIALSGLSLASLALVAETPLALETRDSDTRLGALVRGHKDLGHGLDERHLFRARRTELDADGALHTHLQQYFEGVRVLGGEAILRENHAGMAATADHLSRNLFLQPQPSLKANEALAVAHFRINPRGGYSTPPSAELVIVPVMGLQPRAQTNRPTNAADFEEVILRHDLAYLVHAEIESDLETRHEDVLVDAHTGGVIRHWSTLHTAVHDGLGKSEYSGTVTLSTNSLTSGYELRDMRRAGNTTVNLAGSTTSSGTVYTATADSWGDGANYVATNGSTSANGQTAAVDAHYGMQTTWDFYKNVLGRNGIDGTGRTATSRVHYGSNYDNAFWSDACFCMTYGDGSMFKTLTALDVAGHEMSHGVCATTANLAYYGESGGLNEANSDIFGTLVEFYARGAGATGATVPNTGGNWTIGEQLVTPSFPNPLRYMYKPSLDGSSPDAWSSTLGNLDVHLSSGPMNRAFYFLSQGSSATASSTSYSSYLPAGMTGVGNDKAARIWWRTLSTRLTSTSNYLAARNGAIAAAGELYGANGAEVAAVWNAFAAINVGTAWKPLDTTAPTVSAKVAGTSGSLVFTATATDNVGVTRVDYYVDNTLKGSATASPYTFTFDSTTTTNGAHNLVAKAYDAAANVGTSASVPFTVSNDLTAPVVSAKVTGSGTSFTFTATATDNVGVTKVDYYVDGTLKGTTTASPYTFAFTSTPLTDGSHSLVAKAYDAAGNVGTSAAATFTVANPKDTTAPVVSAKVAGTSGTLTFTATATDNVGVTRVDYYVDGALKGSATASPYTATFVSTALANGSHNLVAKAYDAAGNVGTSATVAFTISNDVTAPVVSAKVAGISGTITFTATATDNVGVTRVDYYVDGALKGSATASPYTATFVSTALSNGSHSLVAKAYDAAGNVGTSAAIAFTLNNDFTAPVISAKVAGSGTSFTFTATATDNVGVTKVEYYVDGTLKGTVTASPYTFAFTSMPLADGNHSLVAKAYDAAGNVGTSATVAFIVANPKDTTAPVVSAKVTGTSGNISFTATATDNVGVTRVDYYVDGTFAGMSTAAPYTATFVSTTVANGSHNLVAKAYDAAGNAGTSATVPFTISNASPTTMVETESNNTVATANVIGNSITTVIGALSTGSDLDTFALTLVAGQSIQITLTSPAGMMYGLNFPQAFAPQGIKVQSLQGSGRQVVTLQATGKGVAQATVYLQVYSMTGQGSSANYTMTIQR